MDGVASALDAASWVPVTKLVPPMVGPEVLIGADRLAWFRDVILRHRLTTLVAQGGSGKSTLVAAAVAAIDVPVAWVRWHSSDDNPSRVVEYVAMALARADAARTDTASVLRSGGAALSVEQVIGLLVNDMASIGPVVLVLDDLHLLRSTEALEVVGALLDLAPPDAHVVVTTRSRPEIPLARLHASGQWARLYADDLRVDEVAASEVLRRHRIDLPPERAVELVAETNGWLVGFLLAARAEASGRSVGGVHVAIADYLAEEVLAREAAQVRRFLQETSVLETLDAAACDVVTGRGDSAELLADLRDRLGFLVIEHDGRLRYHDLLRDHVRAELAATLDPDGIASLHRLAATATDGDARIEHLLAAGDHGAAADAIEARSRAWTRHPATDHQVVEWITRLAPDARSGHPWLELALRSASVLGRSDSDVAPALLAALERAGEDDLELQCFASRLLLMATRDLPHWTPLVDRAAGLERLHPALRVESLSAVAWAELWSGHPYQAFAHAAAAMDIVESTDDAVAAESLALQLAAPLACAPGGVEQLLGYHRRAGERFGPRSRLLDVASRAHIAQLETLRSGPPVADDLSAADRDLLDNLPLFAPLRLWMAAARAIHVGDLAGVEAALTGAVLGGSGQMMQYSTLLSAAYRDQRRPDDVARIAASLETAPTPVRSSPMGRSLAAQVGADLAWAGGDHDQAIEVLRSIVGSPQQVTTGQIPDAGCLLAVVLDEAGRSSEALALLAERVEDLSGRLDSPFRVRQALPAGSDLPERLAQRGRSAAVDAVLAIGRGSERRSSLDVPGTGEVLTAREVEVLGLLANGCSNSQIAAELFVSLNTVKTHVSRVLTKLGAPSRSAAVARAREHGLI